VRKKGNKKATPAMRYFLSDVRGIKQITSINQLKIVYHKSPYIASQKP
jgi:hypothetical protein